MLFKKQSKPYAVAEIAGNANYPDVKGRVSFYDVYGGTFVNIPDYFTPPVRSLGTTIPVYGYH